MFEAEFDRIRSISEEMGCFSWTSREYQDDILNYLVENRQYGCGVVEVGSYKGGLTALLAHVCKEFSWPLYTIDIDISAVESTRKLLSALDSLENTSIHHGNLASFVETEKLAEKPLLIILDGDHRYEAVVDDIHNVYKLSYLPYAAAFHDFSLRHPTSGEKVDLAVKDCLGNWPVKAIGARMNGDDRYPTKDHPSEDGHWWEVPGSEGAVVELPDQLAAKHDFLDSNASPVEKSLLSRVLGRLSGNS
tara:strand:- start:151022 stop:151765 length:744 start_codon:yes stop_codon:yes gene_type:complete